VCRWLPGHRLVLVVDGGFAAVSLALACVNTRVGRVSRLRWDAALFHRPGPQPSGKRGPKPLKGKRQRSLQDWASRSDTPWEDKVGVIPHGGKRYSDVVWCRTVNRRSFTERRAHRIKGNYDAVWNARAPERGQWNPLLSGTTRFVFLPSREPIGASPPSHSVSPQMVTSHDVLTRCGPVSQNSGTHGLQLTGLGPGETR
jgi:hypothetical protein